MRIVTIAFRVFYNTVLLFRKRGVNVWRDESLAELYRKDLVATFFGRREIICRCHNLILMHFRIPARNTVVSCCCCLKYHIVSNKQNLN